MEAKAADSRTRDSNGDKLRHHEELHLLSPNYDEQHHEHYVSYLKWAINQPSAQNIALAAGYGMGKSSILSRLEDQYGDKAFTISFATMREPTVLNNDGQDELIDGRQKSPRGQESETPSGENTANTIQKEIVKQLLYSQPAKNQRGSRFQRLQQFKCRSEWLPTLLLSILIFLVGISVGFIENVASFFLIPDQFVVCFVAISFLLICLFVYYSRFYLHGKINIKHLAAGSGVITLEGSKGTYFDKYLDELINVFESSELRIIIFEDLDRFNNIEIYETLRALNRLINNVPKFKEKRPVKFIYAVKDSLFAIEDSEAGTADGNMPLHADPEALLASRTKFFDLIIPVVPFINHSNSTDLLKLHIKELGVEINQELLQIVGRHIPDMRLIKNILNEFIVFRKVYDEKYGEQEVTRNNDLFPLIVYKNVQAKEFENIRIGRSTLDMLYTSRLDFVEKVESELQRELREVEKLQLGDIRLLEEYSSRITDAVTHIATMYAEGINTPLQQLHYSNGKGNRISYEEFQTLEFWRDAIAQDHGRLLTISWQNRHNGNVVVTRENLSALININLDAKYWDDSSQKSQAEKIHALREKIKNLKKMGFRELIESSYKASINGNAAATFATIANETINNSLIFELVKAGFISIDYAAHASTFDAEHITVNAKNYLIQHVKKHRHNFTYELSPLEASGLLKELSAGDFLTTSILNLNLVDYVLRNKHKYRDQLAVTLQEDGKDQNSFISLYLSQGNEIPAFLELWASDFPPLFRRLLSIPELSEADKYHALQLALENLHPTTAYQTSGNFGEILNQSHFQTNFLSTIEVNPATANTICDVLENHNALIHEIGRTTENLRNSIIDRLLYKVTKDNLTVVLRGEPAFLDKIRLSDPETYSHIIDNLTDYLQAMDEQHVLEGANGFEGIIKDILDGAHSEHLTEFLSKVPQLIKVADLTGVPTEAWQGLVSQGLIESTFDNFTLYKETFGGIDEALEQLLTSAGSISGVENTDEANRLARELINHPGQGLKNKTRKELVRSLGLSLPLKSDVVEPDNSCNLPALIKLDIIQDNQEVLSRLMSCEWLIREEYLATSDVPKEIDSIDLFERDLDLILASKEIPQATKTHILGLANNEPGRLGSKALKTFVSEAPRFKITLSIAAIKSGVDNGEIQGEQIAQLLSPHLRTIEKEELTSILKNLPEPFSQLAEPGTDRPLIPYSRDNQALIDRLREFGIVSTSRKERKNIRVNKRHS